jgi:hypothetical protein
VSFRAWAVSFRDWAVSFRAWAVSFRAWAVSLRDNDLEDRVIGLGLCHLGFTI